MNKDEELTLLNVLNHWHFKEVAAEVERLEKQVADLQKTLDERDKENSHWQRCLTLQYEEEATLEKSFEKQVADLKAQVENLLEFGEYFLCRKCELHSPIDEPCECCPHCGEHPGEPDLDHLCGECKRELNDAIAMRDEIAHGRL